MTGRITWVITDGKAGHVTQAMGLADAMGFDTVEKTIFPAIPWRWLPASLWPRGVSGLGGDTDILSGTPPDLIISCGRHAVGPALWVKSRSQGHSFHIHVEHPRVDLHRVTPQKLTAAAADLAPKLSHLPHPRVAVLLGGNNSVYRLTDAVTDQLADGLQRLTKDFGAGLMVTASRRTGAAAEARLRDRLADLPCEFWDGTGDNPYLGFLGSADAIVVTCDSVNMASEACSTGKPVYVVNLESSRDSKFAAFHKSLADAGITRPFDGTLDTWTYEALDETARVAAELRQRMESAE
jgi:mitochondrial fission protein ELM1